MKFVLFFLMLLSTEEVEAVDYCCRHESNSHRNSDDDNHDELLSRLGLIDHHVIFTGLWFWVDYIISQVFYCFIVSSDVESFEDYELLWFLCGRSPQWIEVAFFWNLVRKERLRILVLQSQKH